MTNYNIDVLLDNMAQQLQSEFEKKGISDPFMIGIHTGGAWVAERLHKILGLSQPLGTLNISFYRDDFTRIGVHPQVAPSTIVTPIENQHIVLVDDVLYTGRTIRAALNEIFDYGRPSSILLSVLVDRSGRELPIQPDVVGMHMDLAENQQIKLTGPEPLELVTNQ